MKTHTKRIAAGIVAVLLILAMLLAADAIYGDPVSRAWANARAVAYAEKLYPGQTFTVESQDSGSFWTYCTWVQSEQSQDTRFDVTTKFWLFTSDEGGMEGLSRHEQMVERRWNTAYRMGEEAAAAVEEVLQKELPQYQFAGTYGAEQRSCDIQLGYTEDSSVMPQEYADLLPLDASFDKSLLQKIPTKLSITGVWPTTPTQADVDTVLADLKRVLTDAGYDFAYYSLTLTDATAPSYEEGMDRLAESGVVAADSISAAQ
ncbi:hypothetical protein [uncultured Gemmiger sp.]|uniref:YfjL-like protein n=1 Tax=uncultured Gemmiger sp. TaxID=1623490 RepID=UPI0025D09E02|nr:hypothetical protein [uncultured Gemmiger sp.]